MIKITSQSKTLLVEYTDGVRLIKTSAESTKFIPKNEWFSCTENFYPMPENLIKEICFLPVDPYISQLFWEKISPLLLSQAKKKREDVLKSYVDDAVKRLENYSGLKLEHLYARELIINPPGLDSTAFNHDKKLSIGLHIDTHNVQDFKKRTEGFQLLAINIGKNKRYFYFSNKTVNEYLNKLGKTDKDYKFIRELKNDYLLNFPKTRIYRMTIPPNHAYSAVTQNIIHDGATNDEGDVDVVLLIAGYFKILKDKKYESWTDSSGYYAANPVL